MKTLYFDFETTGLNPMVHAPIQFAGIIDVDGKIVDEFEYFASPGAMEVDNKALEVNGRTLKEILAWPSQDALHDALCSKFGHHVDKFNSDDRLTPCAFNGWFDYTFMSELFRRAGDKYFGSWTNHRLLDPLPVARFLVHAGVLPPPRNFKQTTLCETFGISTANAHDALADVRMLRSLMMLLSDGIRAVDIEYDPVCHRFFVEE